MRIDKAIERLDTFWNEKETPAVTLGRKVGYYELRIILKLLAQDPKLDPELKVIKSGDYVRVNQGPSGLIGKVGIARHLETIGALAPAWLVEFSEQVPGLTGWFEASQLDVVDEQDSREPADVDLICYGTQHSTQGQDMFRCIPCGCELFFHRVPSFCPNCGRRFRRSK